MDYHQSIWFPWRRCQPTKAVQTRAPAAFVAREAKDHVVSKRRLEVAFAVYLLLVSGQFCASLVAG